VDHSYFQQLLQQHAHQTPKAFSPSQTQVFSPCNTKHSLNTTALMELKAQQQKLLLEHKQKIRKETLDKTIETISVMKSASKKPGQKKNSF
jgi:hypothetical protein